MTNADLVTYYSDLLILQYKTKPKAYATVSAFLKILMIFELLEAVENGYDLDPAIGKQLDVLAKYIGVDRTIVGGSFTRYFFGLTPYGETPPYLNLRGFKRYGDAPVVQAFEQYKDAVGSLYSMTDLELRTMLQMKVILNKTNASLKDIDDNIGNFFDGNCLVYDSTGTLLFGMIPYGATTPYGDIRGFKDYSDTTVKGWSFLSYGDSVAMTVTYSVPAAYQHLMELAVSSKVLVKPAGVGLQVVYT